MSRPLTAELVASADLILTASLENRNQLVRTWPEAAPKAFTLVPFALHCSGRPEGLAGAGVDRPELAVRLREARELVPATEVDRDVPDPMGHPFRTFRRVDAMVERAVDKIVPTPWRWW